MAFVAIWTKSSRAELLSMEVAEFEDWYSTLVRTHNKLNSPAAKNG